MRNGNCCSLLQSRFRFLGSYRTYEEWKHYFLDLCSINHTFLPYLWGMETDERTNAERIYKGFLPYLWGMETLAILQNAWEGLGSYRTYEEWKHHLPMLSLQLCWVLTVPMRNGNSPWWRTCYHRPRVLTVPMRNGNYLSYSLTQHTRTRSYRTYEEWKLPFPLSSIKKALQFLPYLWGMETQHL